MRAFDNLEQKYQLDEHIKKTIAQKKQLIKKFFYQLFCLRIFLLFLTQKTPAAEQKLVIEASIYYLD